MHCDQILIVEDEADARESLKLLLELEGFKVTVASNGREALDVLSHIDTPCLILLDLMMPVMNGWEFLATLDQEHASLAAQTPVVVISAAADIDYSSAPRSRRIVRKPFDIEPLLALVREYCMPIET